jgi:2-polyprenyl-3-methyl-5-hydroxy-6-metoxy-1,4-benzoquinol methylase
VSGEDYLLAGQPSEFDRLQLQSRVWEPSGRQLLSKVGGGSGARVLDVGCGALGWLRILSEWVGPSGRVVGTDVDESLLEAARSFLEAAGISNVEHLRLPLQFSVALESRLLEAVSKDELASLRREAESELAERGRWGTTFTLIQGWGRLEA